MSKWNDPPKFKAGDKIRCLQSISPSDGGPRKGEIFTVVSANDWSVGFELHRLIGDIYTRQTRNGTNPNWGQGSFELVQEEQMKFKVGDKVRVLKTGADGSSLIEGDLVRVRAVGTLDVQVERLDGTRITCPFIGPAYIELVEDELQDLVDKANAGLKALHLLYKTHRAEVEITNSILNKDQFKDLPQELDHTDDHRVIRIKPKKPKFETYFVPGVNWQVRLEGSTLHIGCLPFDLNLFAPALRALLKDHVSDFEVTRLGLQSTRSGIKQGGHVLLWADAEILSEKLNKAGI